MIFLKTRECVTKALTAGSILGAALAIPGPANAATITIQSGGVVTPCFGAGLVDLEHLPLMTVPAYAASPRALPTDRDHSFIAWDPINSPSLYWVSIDTHDSIDSYKNGKRVDTITGAEAVAGMPASADLDRAGSASYQTFLNHNIDAGFFPRDHGVKEAVP